LLIDISKIKTFQSNKKIQSQLFSKVFIGNQPLGYILIYNS